MYTVKFWWEVAFAILGAVLVIAAQLLADFDPEAFVNDPDQWLMVAAGAFARGIGIALLATLTKAGILSATVLAAIRGY